LRGKLVAEWAFEFTSSTKKLIIYYLLKTYLLADFSRQLLQKACRQQGVSIGCLKKSRQIGHLKSSSAISTVVETASHRGLFFFASSFVSSVIFLVFEASNLEVLNKKKYL
jgi:hypothetical protein